MHEDMEHNEVEAARSEEDIERIARICHETNRGHCAAIGDDSQVPWGEAPTWQRESCRAGVRAVIANGYMKPSKQHDLWLSVKLREGWRYGAEKDADAKVHPCLLPYDELPPEQQVKDSIFSAVVRGLS